MIFDFNHSKKVFIVGTIFGVLLSVALAYFANMVVGAVLFFLIFEWVLFRFSKKVAIRSMNDLESVLYKDGNALEYFKQYETMIKKDIGFDKRWLVKKYHNIMVAALVLNDEKRFYQYYDKANDAFDDIYSLLPLFNYFKTLLNTMANYVFNNQKTLNNLKVDFKKLDQPIQNQILNNPFSFHNWVSKTKDFKEENYPLILVELETNRKRNTNSKN